MKEQILRREIFCILSIVTAKSRVLYQLLVAHNNVILRSENISPYTEEIIKKLCKEVIDAIAEFVAYKKTFADSELECDQVYQDLNVYANLLNPILPTAGILKDLMGTPTAKWMNLNFMKMLHAYPERIEAIDSDISNKLTLAMLV